MTNLDEWKINLTPSRFAKLILCKTAGCRACPVNPAPHGAVCENGKENTCHQAIQEWANKEV